MHRSNEIFKRKSCSRKLDEKERNEHQRKRARLQEQQQQALQGHINRQFDQTKQCKARPI